MTHSIASEPTLPPTKPRRPWLAALGNICAAPMGHVYAGKPARGFVAYLLYVALYSVVWASLFVAFGAWLIAIVALFVAAVALVADAYWVAKRSGDSYQLRSFNRWYVYVLGAISLIVINAMADGVRKEFGQTYKIPSAAMMPTLKIGDHIMVDNRIYRAEPPGRFDVVVFEYPEDPTKNFVKRIVGLPGDEIEVRNKIVWLNGSQLDESYVVYSEDGRSISKRDNFGPFPVPAITTS